MFFFRYSYVYNKGGLKDVNVLKCLVSDEQMPDEFLDIINEVKKL